MQRVRLIEPDGTEHLVPEATPEEKILRLAQAVYEAETAPAEAAHAAPAAGAAEPGAAAEASEAAFASAVDFVLKARAELEPILDIIGQLETNEQLAIVEVQRPSAKVETLIADLAVRAQSKYSEIQAAAATLRRASVATRGAAERSQRFYSELAQLQHSARLLPAPGGGVGAGAAFLFDVSFPGLPTPPADVHVLVAPSETGSICVLGVQPPAVGVDAVRAVLRAKQASHFQSALAQHLRDEVGALAAEDGSGALAALEAELQRAIEARAAGAALGRDARAWLRLTETLFLDVLAYHAAGGAAAAPDAAAAAAGPPRTLPRLLSQLQHAAAALTVHAALAAAVTALRDADTAQGLPALLRRHITGDPHLSAWEVVSPGLPPVSVVLRGTDAHVEGVRTDEPLDLPSAGVPATSSWLPFWVADALCKHVLLALRRRALDAGLEVVDGRRHLRIAGAHGGLRIAGTATKTGAITWGVTTAVGGSVVDVPWAPRGGKSAMDVLAELISTRLCQ